MYIRPKLKDVCSVVEAVGQYWSGCLYLKLTESGGFDVVKHIDEGAVLIMLPWGRKQVRKALDLAENNLHDRRRETNARKTTEQDE